MMKNVLTILLIIFCYTLFAQQNGGTGNDNGQRVNGSLFLPSTTSVLGQISWNSGSLLHNIGGSNAIWLGGNLTMTGADNVCIGENAGLALTSAGDNILIGDNAGKNLTTGNDNIYIGEDAGYLGGNSATLNVCIGRRAGASYIGQGSLILGYESGYLQQSGNYNVILGYKAFRGAGSTSNDRNISIGYNSAYNVGAGVDYAICIGDSAGYNIDRGNVIYIGQGGNFDPDLYTSIAIDEAQDTGAFNFNARFRYAQSVNITTVNTATYSVLPTDYILHVTYTSTGAVNSLDLPTAQVVYGRIIKVKDAGFNATTNNITITTEGLETIDGAVTYVIDTDRKSIELYSDGANWYVNE
jgi:hypothetical protein